MPVADFIGPVDSLFPLRWGESYQTDLAPVYEVREAARARYAYRRRGRPLRSWKVALEGQNEDRATLEALYNGAWGPGPFWFVSQAAAVSNALTPAQTSLSGLQNIGPMPVAGGREPRSISATGKTVRLVNNAPIPPDSPITFTVDAIGPGTLRIIWNLETLNNHSSSTFKAFSTTGFHRPSLTALTPPPTATTYSLEVYNFAQVSRPQITYTPNPVPYAPGAGCDKAIITNLTTDFSLYDPADNNSWWPMTLDITEIGA